MAQYHKIFHFQLHPIPQRAQGPLGQNWAKSGMPGQAWAWPPQSDTLGFFLSWMSIYMQKIKVRYQLLQEISSLKESCNLIGREVLADNSRTRFFPDMRFSQNESLYSPLTSCTVSQKTLEPILRKVGNGQTDRLTDGRDWIHRTLRERWSKMWMSRQEMEWVPH